MSFTLVPQNGDHSAVGLEHVTRCLFCDNAEFSQTYDGVRDFFFKADDGHFTYRRCSNCRSLWLQDRPTGDRLLKAYSTYHTHTEPQPITRRKGLRGKLRSIYLRSRFSEPVGAIDRLMIEFTKALLPDNFGINRQLRFAPRAPAKILDYGCGSGEYLLWLAPMGYALSGVEYDPDLLTSVAARGIEIADVATVEQQPWDDTFDHITLSHVLEHVADPLSLLARLFAWLKPEGTLFVEVPNADATGLEIFDRYWRGLEAPRHFAMPTRSALIASLEKTGFIIAQNDVVRLVRSGIWDQSLSMCPEGEWAGRQAAMIAAPPETTTNAEYLTFVARKPA
jgi:2-polyprenyl-3-methyl-5-hydroxy-6-metoxy-1,4-benzoquinol methylase